MKTKRLDVHAYARALNRLKTLARSPAASTRQYIISSSCTLHA